MFLLSVVWIFTDDLIQVIFALIRCIVELSHRMKWFVTIIQSLCVLMYLVDCSLKVRRERLDSMIVSSSRSLPMVVVSICPIGFLIDWNLF